MFTLKLSHTVYTQILKKSLPVNQEVFFKLLLYTCFTGRGKVGSTQCLLNRMHVDCTNKIQYVPGNVF